MDAMRFADLAKSLAWQLGQLRGEEWIAQLDERAATSGKLTGPDHARLGISWSDRDHRLTVCGHYPEGTGGTAYQARVDPQRGLLVIGRDINRRVLEAGYLAVLARQVERKAAMDQTSAERASWLDAVAALFGIGPTTVGPGMDPAKVYLGRFVKGRGHVESYWDGSGHLDIDLSGIPAQVALDMLKVLADSQPGASCCYTYGPGHPPQFAVAGCLRAKSERGVMASERRVADFLAHAGVTEDQAQAALREAVARGASVIEPDGRVLAVVTWDHEGCGEYTAEVPRGKS